jgi:hypothetical protein
MKLRVLLVAAVAALGFAACGGDDKSAQPTPAPATTSPATTRTTPPGTSASATAPADGTVDPLGAGQTTPWTVKPPKEPVTGRVTVKDLRLGVHPELGGWERIVFEFSGDAWPPATVQYVGNAVACGSGQPISGLKGNVILEVAFTSAQSHGNDGNPTIPGEVNGPGKTVLNGLRACDFEGHVTWDFGLTGKQNFKVSTLTNPPRVVIDVKQ